jgi:Radical SAM superfamily/4Fe-4S single cluster domain
MTVPRRTDDRILLAPVPAAAFAADLADFRDYRCRADQLKHILGRLERRRLDAAEFMPMIQMLAQRRAGGFADVLELKAQACGGDAPPSHATITTMRDLFLQIPNRALQRLCRDYLANSPPAPGSSHDEKIASLEAVGHQAREIVSAYDWRWLADWLRLDLIGETAETCLRRLSNFAFPVKGVTFRFTYHCNISCRHCYNGSGPHAKAQRLDVNAMRSLIAQMPDAGIPWLNITGGEPFLYPDEVLALIIAGRKAGLPEISIYTNGFWADTPERTERMLLRLAGAGFMQGPRDHLQVSAGVYHQEFIELDRAFVLANCYYRMFGRRLPLNFELPAGGQRKAHEDSVRQKLAAAGVAHCVLLSFRAIDRVGRGRDLVDSALRQIDQPCRVIEQIVIDPDGAARPCCGFNNENQGVKIGELGRHGLRDLVKRMQNDPILQFLARNPMGAIFDHVAGEKNAAGYAGLCSLCQHALGNLANKEALQARLFEQQEFYPFWFARQPEAANHVYA